MTNSFASVNQGLIRPQRFEYKSADRSTAQKIEATVRFPASLNMAEYTTLVMKAHEADREKGQKVEGFAPSL